MHFEITFVDYRRSGKMMQLDIGKLDIHKIGDLVIFYVKTYQKQKNETGIINRFRFIFFGGP